MVLRALQDEDATTAEEALAAAIDLINDAVIASGPREPVARDDLRVSEATIVWIAGDGTKLRSFQRAGIKSAEVAAALRSGLLRVVT